MKYNIVVVPLLLLSGCTGGYSTMQYQDLNSFVVDCKHQDQQMFFLKQQLQNTSKYDTSKRAVVKHAIREIKSYCQSPIPSEQSGCLTVQEQLNADPATSVICRVRGRASPVINVWQTEIDK